VLEIRSLALCSRARPDAEPLCQVLACAFIDGTRAAREKIAARSVTAVARSKPLQDARLVMKAKVFLEKVV
jgi:hypothetical protein